MAPRRTPKDPLSDAGFGSIHGQNYRKIAPGVTPPGDFSFYIDFYLEYSHFLAAPTSPTREHSLYSLEYSRM